MATFESSVSVFASAFLMAGCMGAYAEPEAAPAPPEPIEKSDGLCGADPVQTYVGKTVSSEIGAAVLQQSGARILRWGPPDTAWTMDFRQDRVSISYDREMVITRITCG